MKPLEMGIYDDLDTQTQPLLNVDTLKDNIIVFGGHMTGKTTFLKTLILRMHHNFQWGDNEEIYIIDFGGNLSEYGKMPMVSACFDNSNEEDIRRVFKTVENRLEHNKKMLKSSQFYEVYNEDSDIEKPVHITLIVDNISSFLADERNEMYHETLMNFCRDGLSKGLSVIFTASDTGNGIGRFMSSFGKRFAFDVPMEVYIDVFGMKVDEPIKKPGRGVAVVDGKPREFHTFMPFMNEKEELGPFLDYVSTLDYSTNKLKAFNGDLTYDNFGEFSSDGRGIEELEQDEIAVVGLDYYDHEPVVINFHDIHSIAIYGKKKFGKSNLLYVLLGAMWRKHPYYRYVFLDDGRRQLENLHVPDNDNQFYFTKVEQLVDFLDSNGYHGKPGNRSFQEKETPPTVFVLQSKMLFQSVGKNVLSIFSKLTAVAEEKGLYFIYSDVRKSGSGDREAESFLNNSLSAAFLLDSIAEFVADKGSRSVFGEMDPKELKNEYARCELGDGYFYDIESDELKKLKFIRV